MLAIIASVSTPHGIYRVGNNTPWPAINRDKEVVRSMTNGQIIVVGPTTYSILPKNLSPELCIVVNNSSSTIAEGHFDYLSCENVEGAIALAKKSLPNKKVYFLGGEKILAEALRYCTDAYITEVDCDCRSQSPTFGPLTFFPEALALRDDREWMIGGLFNFKEKLGDLGITIDLKYIHYEKVDGRFIGKD
jgi:dihydrofolate reductase